MFLIYFEITVIIFNTLVILLEMLGFFLPLSFIILINLNNFVCVTQLCSSNISFNQDI